MIWCDSDFLIALLKSDDIWKDVANRLYRKHEKQLAVNAFTLVELLLVSDRFGFNPEKLIWSISEMFHVEADVGQFLSVAHLMAEHQMTVFDALNAVVVRGGTIISSDKAYDAVGVNRIKMEEMRKQSSKSR